MPPGLNSFPLYKDTGKLREITMHQLFINSLSPRNSSPGSSAITALSTYQHYVWWVTHWQETATGRKWNRKVWFSGLYHITYIAGLKCFLMIEKQLNSGPAPSWWQVFKSSSSSLRLLWTPFPNHRTVGYEGREQFVTSLKPPATRPDSISLPTNSLKYTALGS